MNMIRIYKIVMVVLLVMVSVTLGFEGTWSRKADIPTARLCPSSAVVNGKIYVIGGGRGISGPYLSTVEVYDPATDTWTQKPDMPTRRNGHATAVVNGRIYVIGGEPSPKASLATVEEYNPTTDTWTQKADMPTKRTFLCACALDGKIYVFGGVTAGVPGATRNPPALEVYDPATDEWTTRTSMLFPRALAGACVVNGQIYVMGGVIGHFPNPAISTVEVYDPETDTWTVKANVPTKRAGLSMSALGGKVYAIGGGTFGGATYSKVEEYDPSTDTWTTKPDMLTARLGLSTSVVNGRIYAIGGARDFHPALGMSTVEEYDTGLSSPSPDFNGDGIVDIKDLLMLIESWNQDDPIVDIAPPPFGDGIVDALDLELLMNYWKQPVDDPTLLAHWALDETEGIIAYDTAGVNDAVVVGGIEWQPIGGQIDGALHLDGINGYVVAGPVLNPADGPFSVFAWIQGGAPGQVVVSQQGMANWLTTDAEDNLMTELKGTGRSTGPLFSETIITDGQWHRICFVWDGTNRALYVDDILVAEDTQANLKGSVDGLYIGTGKAMEPGTYWSGLIDDVRIYNRAVRP